MPKAYAVARIAQFLVPKSLPPMPSSRARRSLQGLIDGFKQLASFFDGFMLPQSDQDARRMAELQRLER
jgi:hypothetical protein